MRSIPYLTPGDTVELIAPASRCSDQRIKAVVELLSSWQLNCLVASDIFGHDLLCANSDEVRFKHLQNALFHSQSKAVICARGGYGSMRLIPALDKLVIPSIPKWFIGMSDITALHLFFQNKWQWPTIHAGVAPDQFSLDSINALRDLIFGNKSQVDFSNLQPLNLAAENLSELDGVLTGGNLTLLQTSLGTIWQINAKNKILLIEEIGERAYRVDRMLEHLKQASVFSGVKAIVFADFLDGNEPDGSSLIAQTLQRFADACSVPVLQMEGVGHGETNFPVPFGSKAILTGGEKSLLRVLVAEM